MCWRPERLVTNLVIIFLLSLLQFTLGSSCRWFVPPKLGSLIDCSTIVLLPLAPILYLSLPLNQAQAECCFLISQCFHILYYSKMSFLVEIKFITED